MKSFQLISKAHLLRWNLENYERWQTCIKTTPGEFENATTTVILELCLKEPRLGKAQDFSSTRKRQAGVCKFLRLEELIRNAPFSQRIGIDGGPSGHNAIVQTYSVLRLAWLQNREMWEIKQTTISLPAGSFGL